MATIQTESYVVKPSDSREWIILESNDGITVDVELKILDFRYDCVPKKIQVNGKEINCSQLCCYTGCYISSDEIKRTKEILPKIKDFLQRDAINQIFTQKKDFYLKNDYDKDEDLYKLCCVPEEWNYDGDGTDEEKDAKEIPPKNHCVFLMENGYCATHKYYIDNNIDWVKEKFNICTTFPLDIRPQDNTLAFMDGFDDFTYADVDCISSDEELKKELGMPQIIDSMKYAIVDRYSEQFWETLRNFGLEYRKGKISIDKIYEDTDIK